MNSVALGRAPQFQYTETIYSATMGRDCNDASNRLSRGRTLGGVGEWGPKGLRLPDYPFRPLLPYAIHHFLGLTLSVPHESFSLFLQVLHDSVVFLLAFVACKSGNHVIQAEEYHNVQQ